ncbi:MAG: nucleoside-diphosphate kinase [Candidatus Altiarchaeales archaeon]|nr:nucleoside-diphosphate kinase [Candidatus Altiarchaeota archaeon]MBU4406365.1 nucleoside-diphosphate kinase [Candidatus Altiarchaeota archaeon]MBU4437499.1 nucleoside-diphosphate kinase [Candidatus Altiarchaeota archaeon]MCG2782419.1 nucleoside-diphosphate kinase [Candidatus Altiarchaeales archaeon]
MKTLLLMKPWAVQKGLIGEILSRFERRGLKIAGLKILDVSKEMAEDLYLIHRDKDFYDDLIEHITSSPIVAVVLDTDVLEPDAAVALVRKIIGATDPAKAEMGTIRGDFGLRIDRNVVHASDSTDSAKREIPIFFKKEEMVTY